MKKLLAIIAILALLVPFMVSCDGEATTGTALAPARQPVRTDIALQGDNVNIDGNGATWSDRRLVIDLPGVYTLSGELNDGIIVVDVRRTEQVELILDNVTISNSTTAVVHVMDADRVYFTMPVGSLNVFTDAYFYTYEDGEARPHSTIYSRRDITFRGGGKLMVNANYRNAIWSARRVRVNDGYLVIDAAHNGIRARDSIRFDNANVFIDCGSDGLRVTSEDEAENRGFIRIDGSEVTIIAGDDAMQFRGRIDIATSSVTATAGRRILNSRDAEINIQDGNLIER